MSYRPWRNACVRAEKPIHAWSDGGCAGTVEADDEAVRGSARLGLFLFFIIFIFIFIFIFSGFRSDAGRR
jgi:hypothetical protein